MLIDIRDTPAGTGPDTPGPRRTDDAVRTRRTDSLADHIALTGAVLTLAGVVLASGAVLLPGVLLLLVALLHRGASDCTSADHLAGWPWRGVRCRSASVPDAHICRIHCGRGPAEGASLAPRNASQDLFDKFEFRR